MNRELIHQVMEKVGCQDTEQLMLRLLINYPETKKQILSVKGVGRKNFASLLSSLGLEESCKSVSHATIYTYLA